MKNLTEDLKKALELKAEDFYPLWVDREADGIAVAGRANALISAKIDAIGTHELFYRTGYMSGWQGFTEGVHYSHRALLICAEKIEDKT